jgi:tRNA pseudouridine38-40 synthase
MAKIKLIVAYDGTDYVGWQYQPNGLSIQQCLEQAIANLTEQVHTVYSSGRTDAGVHALGMVCHLTSERQLPLKAWREGVNSFLPPDIVVRDAEFVSDDFHARFNAVGKHYRYTILRDPIRWPLQRRTSWQLKYKLDVQQMRRAADLFVGCHDFAAFRTTGCAAETTQRNIFSVEISESGALMYIDVCGSGFLKNMVRMMVGTLVEVGRNKRPPEVISRMLEQPACGAPAVTAPPHGLCLVEVYY